MLPHSLFPEDVSTTCFKDVVWLQSFPLTADSILDYFSQSPFYDRSCNNEVLRMQSSYNSLFEKNHSQRLREMTSGFEYRTVAAALSQAPGLFLVHKVQKLAESETKLLASYYVVDGVIYQCPDLYSLLNSRLTNCLSMVRDAVDLLVEDGGRSPAELDDGAPQSAESLFIRAAIKSVLDQR